MRWMPFLAILLVLFSSPSHASISTLAVSGDSAAGITGAKFESFSRLSLNSNGHAVFVATLQDTLGGVSSTDDQVLYTFTGGSLSLQAREGSGGVPGVVNADFDDFKDVAIADTGEVLARASLATGTGGVTASTNQGLWRLSTGGDALVARHGAGDAPGVSGTAFKTIPTAIRTTENGDAAFVGQLAPGGAVNLTNDSGLWFYQGTAGTLIVREAFSSAPGVPGATFSSPGTPSINNNTQGTARAVLNEVGGINTNNSSGVWRYTGINGELLAREGVGMAPGTIASFSLFQNPVINDSGQVAFKAELASGSEGLWKYTGLSGELVAISNTGSVPGIPSASFSAFDEPRFADTGTIVTRADLNTGPGGIVSGNNSGIWRFDTGSDELLARTGSGGVPGIAGANFSAFDEYTANADGSAVVLASLEIGPGGVGSSNNGGIWLLPAIGAPELIARKGDQLAGRTIADFSLLSDDFVGRPIRGLNNQNQLLFQVDFASGEGEGLFLFTPGGGFSADFNTDTFVDVTDLGIWKAAYATTTTGGDADGDGDTDGADFLAWQRQYTGPGTLASNLIVPEPSGICLVLTLLGFLLPRRLAG